ncbi:MAG: hypothetical protein FWD34_10335 [Oscillospiraceae bacterium]|nr:hypothetical protein [Oscillospiraceae bacterium]
MQNEVHIKITTEGIEFDAKGDSDFIERERNAFEVKILPLGVDAVARTRSVSSPQIMEQNEYLTTLEVNSAISQDLQTNTIDWNRISLGEFIKQKGAESHSDFILCASYFMEKTKNICDFSTEDVKEYYKEARKSEPKNISDSVGKLATNTFLKCVSKSTPKRYQLTQSGIDCVEKMQPKEGKEKKVSTKPRKAKPKTESQYASISVDDLNIKDFPEIKSLKTFKEKMVLILYMVKTADIGEWFSVADVECLMIDVFGESVNTQQIIDAFNYNKTWYKAEKNNGVTKRKLLNGSIDFAKSLIPTS